MTKPTLTYKLAMAAARDVADRRMRSQGRKKWNRDDYNAMCAEFERLEAANRNLLKALQSAQWAYDGEENPLFCPSCHGSWPTHRETCIVGVTLASYAIKEPK